MTMKKDNLDFYVRNRTRGEIVEFIESLIDSVNDARQERDELEGEKKTQAIKLCAAREEIYELDNALKRSGIRNRELTRHADRRVS